MKKEKIIAFVHLVGLTLMHLGAVYSIFALDWNVELFLVFFISYQIKITGITVGFHRLFTHQSFKANNFIKILLAVSGTFAGQGPVLRWVAHHLTHHRYSDKDKDLHSPVVRGFFYSHLGWLLNPTSFRDQEAKHLESKYPKVIRLISRNFTLIFFAQVPLLYFLGSKEYILAGFFPSTLLTIHSTFFVNSLCHMWGSRLYDTKDNSRNNLFVALLTNGEGWHNNHHHRPSCAKQGVLAHQIDLSYFFIITLEKIGWVSHVRRK